MEDRLVKAPPKAPAKAPQGVVPGVSAHHDLPLFIDGWTTGGGHHGIVNLTLGTLIYGTDGTAPSLPARRRLRSSQSPPTDTKLN